MPTWPWRHWCDVNVTLQVLEGRGFFWKWDRSWVLSQKQIYNLSVCFFMCNIFTYVYRLQWTAFAGLYIHKYKYISYPRGQITLEKTFLMSITFFFNWIKKGYVKVTAINWLRLLPCNRNVVFGSSWLDVIQEGNIWSVSHIWNQQGIYSSLNISNQRLAQQLFIVGEERKKRKRGWMYGRNSEYSPVV